MSSSPITYELIGATATFNVAGTDVLDMLSGTFTFDPADQTLSAVDITVSGAVNVGVYDVPVSATNVGIVAGPLPTLFIDFTSDLADAPAIIGAIDFFSPSLGLSGVTGTADPISAPTAAPDRAHVQEGHSVTADAAHGVLANDSDPIPNDALTVSEVDGQATNVGIAVAGTYGILTLNANGSYTYVATAHDKALPSDGVGLDTFTYTAKDGVGDTADTTLSVVVTAPGITYLGGTANTTIDGGNKVQQVLDGGAGNDVVVAGTGTQVLIGGPGDTLTGGAHGADTFVFPPNFGNETITNFDVHHDTIQLPHSEFTNVAAVLADIHQVGANVEIAPDVNDVITLNNLTAAQLHASNFHLV